MADSMLLVRMGLAYPAIQVVKVICGQLLIIGLLMGEANRLDVARVTWESGIAVIYLIAVALVAVPSYTWLLTVTSPALVGTYAFVNPVVAVLLGWAVGETLSERTGLAAVLVITGVVLLIRAPTSSRRIASQTHSLPDSLPARKSQ